MEGNIMFNLLYKKYKNDILKFSAWEEFKKLRFYEKAFLIEVIFCAILEYFFAFISKLNGFVVVLVILLFCFIAFKVKRNKTEEQNRIIYEVIKPEATKRMQQMIVLLKEFHIDISDDQQLDRLIERAKKEQINYDVLLDLKAPSVSVATYILLPALTLFLQRLFEKSGLMEMVQRILLLLVLCGIAVVVIYSFSNIFKELFNKDFRNLDCFIKDIEDIRDFHNKAFLIKQEINGK